MCGIPQGIAAAQIVGTIINAYGQFKQGQTSAAQSNFTAQIATNNAIIAGNNATAVIEKGQADIRDVRRVTGQRIGLQRAQLAGAGFDVSEGTAIDIVGDTAALGELDTLRIDADAANRARNFKAQAANFQTEAALNVFAGKSAERAGKIAAIGTLISGSARTGTGFLARKP